MILKSRNESAILQEELASISQRSSELKCRVAELEAQNNLLRDQVVSSQSRTAEVEYQMALLRGAQDAECAKAFRLGLEETRASIFQKYPNLDLPLLEAEDFNAQTPMAEVSEEDEYEDLQDAEVEDQKGKTLLSEAKVPEAGILEEGGPSLVGEADTSEVRMHEGGGPSQPSPMPIDSSSEIGPAP